MTTNGDPAEQTIVFDEGMPGFPEHRNFQLIDFAGGESAFQMLQSTDDGDMALIVCSPWLFFPDYTPEITDADREGLGLANADDAVVFCPVTISSDHALSVNLLGPFIVNATTRQGRQVVLVDSDYSVRMPIEVV